MEGTEQVVQKAQPGKSGAIMPNGAVQSTSRRIETLTTLRFFAAFLVLLSHYEKRLDLHGTLLRPLALHGGETGVGFFFVLSGFVLTYTYARKTEGGWGRRRYREFMLARFARIYPMHLFGLLLMTGVMLIFVLGYPQERETFHINVSPANAFSGWIANLLLIQVYIPSKGSRMWNSPAWSIATEAVFYMVFPLFLNVVMHRISRIRWLIVAGLTAVIIGVGIRLFLLHTIQATHLTPLVKAQINQAFDCLFLTRLYEFFLGCCTGAILLRIKVQHQESQDFRPVLRAGIAIALTLLLVFCIERFWSYTNLNYFFAPLYAALILTLALGRTPLSVILEMPLLVLLGEASYALYITHWPMNWALERLHDLGYHWPPIVGWVAIVISVILSVVFYRQLEVPSREWLRRKSSVQAIPASPLPTSYGQSGERQQ